MISLSIIVPVYNVEKYLNRCVESIVNQTLSDIEIILIDDQSPDNCPNICDNWALKDKRIKVVHKKNGGLGYARNSGLEIATGEYVAFIDSDDLVNTNTFKICYDHAIEDNLDVCYFSFKRFSYDCDIDQDNIENGSYEILSGAEKCQEYLLDMVGKIPGDNSTKNYSMSSCMAIFRRSIFEENSIRFVSEKNIASEDLLFHLDYLPHVNKIGRLSNMFYYYYINPGSISHSYNDGKRERMLGLLNIVPVILAKHFPSDIYQPHYYSQIMRIFKIIIKFESKSHLSITQKINRISKLRNLDYFSEMCADPIINKYSGINKLIIYCLRKNYILPLILLYKYLK